VTFLPPAYLRPLLDAEPEDRARVIADMSPHDLLKLDADFETWAHEAQRAPSGEGWKLWLMMAGRGFGKTRAGAEWVHRLALGPAVRIALVGASIDEARAVMVEGPSGLLNVARNHGVKLMWEPSRSQVTWPRGTVAQLYSGAHPDGLRGPEQNFAWCAADPGCCAVRGR
jgi:phage terminase large subunit-like protein